MTNETDVLMKWEEIAITHHSTLPSRGEKKKKTLCLTPFTPFCLKKVIIIP
jgi:hypothetical protein